MKTRFALLVGVLVIASMLLTACPAPTPQVVEKVVTQIVEQKVEVIQTQIVEKTVVRPRSWRRSSRRPRRPKPSPSSPGCSMTRATWIPRAMSVWGTNTCATRSPSSTRPSRASGSGTTNSPLGTARQPRSSRPSRPVLRCPISWTFRVHQVNQLLQERHDAGPDRVGEGAAVVRPDGRKRAEDVHGPRRQALLHPDGTPAFHGFRLEGSLPQRLPEDHRRDAEGG